jgi:riboflavin transporter FmnP
MHETKLRRHLRYSVAIAMFAALAYVCVFVFRFKVAFLTLDVKDALMAVGALALGPSAGVLISLVVALLEFITVSDTGVYGLIMNILSSASFTLTVSLVYRFRRRLSSAVLGLVAAVFVTTSVMMLANLFITPFYMGAKRAQVVEMLPTLLLPFNLTKSTLNAAVVLLLYKPLTNALVRAGLMSGLGGRREGALASKLLTPRTFLLWGISILLIAACATVLIVGLGGSFNLFA